MAQEQDHDDEVVDAQDDQPGAGIELLEQRLSVKLGGLAGFDPTIIISIIMAIVQMISGCKNPTAKALRQRVGNTTPLALLIRRQCDLSNRECAQLAIQVMNLANDPQTKDEELQLLIKDVLR